MEGWSEAVRGMGRRDEGRMGVGKERGMGKARTGVRIRWRRVWLCSIMCSGDRPAREEFIPARV